MFGKYHENQCCRSALVSVQTESGILAQCGSGSSLFHHITAEVGTRSFFQVRSPLNFYPWTAIALSLILMIFRFAHRSIALKKIGGSLLEKGAKSSVVDP